MTEKTVKLDAMLDGFTVTGGNAAVGTGGGILSEGSFTLSNCVICDNQAASSGGGLCLVYYDTSVITNCVFSGNKADGWGGAIATFLYSHPTLINCVFVDNETNYGGGIYNNDSGPILINCTFYGNTADSNGNDMYNHDSSPKLTNCILWDDSPVYNSSSSPTYNYCNVKGGVSGGTGNKNEDPKFDDVTDPDGDDGDFMTEDDGLRLGMYSPCIDEGDDDSVPDGIDKDLKGDGRINETVDMGAYEYHSPCPVVHVDIDANTGGDGSSWVNAFKYLQDGLDAAGDSSETWVEIWVADGNYYPDEGDDPENSFCLRYGVGLYGGFEGDETSKGQRNWEVYETILSGDVDQDDVNGVICDYNKNQVVWGADNAIIDGFTITAASINGMRNYEVSPMVCNCIFRGNGKNGYGGGMYNHNSDCLVFDCTFQNNTADSHGGGMYNKADSDGRHTIIRRCIFKENTAAYNGGGMSNDNVFPRYGYALEVSDCIFIDNDACDYGGGLYNYDCETSIVNCVFSGNAAGKNGGGVEDEDGARLINCLFVNNRAKGTGTSGYGGGLVALVSGTEIIGCTFYGNSANYGGAAAWVTDPQNSIFWGNEAVSYGDEIVIGGYTDFYNCDIAPGGVEPPGDADYHDCIHTDPCFVTPGDPDGIDNKFKTGDDGLRIESTSQCIDDGDNDFVNEDYDIKGDERIIDGDENTSEIVDIGAYEYKP